MNILLNIVKVGLFMLLVPGVLFSLPAGESLKIQAIVHGLLFALLIHFLYRYLREGFPDTRVNPQCPQGYEQSKNGDCFLKNSTPQEFL